MQSLKYYVPGSILILIALIMVAVPEILIALLAAFIITAGICALYVGHMTRKWERDLGDFDRFSERSKPYGWSYVRVPVFRRRFRRF